MRCGLFKLRTKRQCYQPDDIFPNDRIEIIEPRDYRTRIDLGKSWQLSFPGRVYGVACGRLKNQHMPFKGSFGNLCSQVPPVLLSKNQPHNLRIDSSRSSSTGSTYCAYSFCVNNCMADFNTTRSQANQAYFGQEMSGERIKLTTQHILAVYHCIKPKNGILEPSLLCFSFH